MTAPGSHYRLWIYLLVAIGLVLALPFIYHFVYRFPFWTLHAFKVSSSSFCPTICKGERVLVQMQNGEPYVPKKGDVIAFEYGPNRETFLKRVIGLPGDVVARAPGADLTILVNGRPWRPPPVCAKSPASQNDGDTSLFDSFHSTRVPEGQLFVIGDNLYNSFDSRIQGFEPCNSRQSHREASHALLVARQFAHRLSDSLIFVRVHCFDETLRSCNSLSAMVGRLINGQQHFLCFSANVQ